jgi:DNA-binding CsgD family transcriptional regulator
MFKSDRICAMHRPSDKETKILACLESGEKSLLEVFQKTGIDYSSVRIVMMRLFRKGVVERRLEEKPKSRRSRRHLYRLTRSA